MSSRLRRNVILIASVVIIALLAGYLYISTRPPATGDVKMYSLSEDEVSYSGLNHAVWSVNVTNTGNMPITGIVGVFSMNLTAGQFTCSDCSGSFYKDLPNYTGMQGFLYVTSFFNSKNGKALGTTNVLYGGETAWVTLDLTGPFSTGVTGIEAMITINFADSSSVSNTYTLNSNGTTA